MRRRATTPFAFQPVVHHFVEPAYLIATSEGYLDLLRLTLANGAKVNDKDSWYGTGLIRAAERGHSSSSASCCRRTSTRTT